MKYVTRYFNALLPILAALQFTKGGPIIAFQVENEYGSTEQRGKFVPDKLYLEKLRQLFLQHGIVELLVTSDSPTGHGSVGTMPEYFLQTANFAADPEKEFNRLKQLQKDKPTMAMEFWTGWFDHWSEQHHLRDNNEFENVFERILRYPASVNMYMFHGGTNWGFLNGANIKDGSTDNRGFQPDTTSYDYDAPLNEAGDYTEKYTIVKNLIAKYNPVKTRIPLPPAVTPRTIYPKLLIEKQLELSQILEQAPHLKSERVVPMEALDINNDSGQSYGYIVYKKSNLDLEPNSILTIQGRVCDSVMVLVNGVLVSKPLTSRDDLNGFGYWRTLNASLNLGPEAIKQGRLELVVENWGRNNFGSLDQFLQYKGLWQGGVYLNGEELLDWEIIPLEFKKTWNEGLVDWKKPVNVWIPRPALYKASFFTVNPMDTYVNMQGWTKGIVMVNGFVLGRYASALGPQQTLYLPAPLQKKGGNEILVFEHFYAANNVAFSADPFFHTPSRQNSPVVLSNQ